MTYCYFYTFDFSALWLYFLFAFFRFSSILLSSSLGKNSCCFEIEYLLGISRIGVILFKSVEAVISSGELSAGSIVLRAVNEVLVRKVRDFERWLLK